MKNCAEHCEEPQIVGSRPAICLRVIKPERAARRAGEHGPIGVFFFAHFARIFEHEHRARFHLLGNPLADNAQFTDHHASRLALMLCEPCVRAAPVLKLQLSCEAESRLVPSLLELFLPELFSPRTYLSPNYLSSHPADFIAQAYIEHRLRRIL